jgi:phosphatidylserine/phosphatidylglycerophosphate/cardiolipin synthase-like enzyme
VAAEQGILFMMFNPGPVGTLLNDIVERTSPASPTYDPALHVHGVINQDPSTTEHPVVGLLHRGELLRADIDVVLPAAVDSDHDFWLQELNYSLVMVHSKCIVVDPFGAHPSVMTGSHNMGPKASGKNDDNLVLIDGQRKLAEAYAVYIMGVYNQYRWRYYQRLAAAGELEATDAADGAVPTWAGLVDDASWQDRYFQPGPAQRELAFWMPALS